MCSGSCSVYSNCMRGCAAASGDTSPLKYACRSSASRNASLVVKTTSLKVMSSQNLHETGTALAYSPNASCNSSYSRPSRTHEITTSGALVSRQQSVCQHASRKVEVVTASLLAHDSTLAITAVVSESVRTSG